MLVLGIAMAGLFPLVIMYSRGLGSLERRSQMSGQWYLVPSSDVWARKLGTGASVTLQDPGPKPPPPLVTSDDGDPGYTEASVGWTPTEPNPNAFQNDCTRHPPVAIGTPRSPTDT